MRLYEFTDPHKYLLPETDAAEVLKQSNKTADTRDNADRLSRQKPKTKHPTNMV
jgi:hypothetical protein